MEEPKREFGSQGMNLMRGGIPNQVFITEIKAEMPTRAQKNPMEATELWKGRAQAQGVRV